MFFFCTVRYSQYQDISYPKQLAAKLPTPVAPRLNAHIQNCVMWDFQTHMKRIKKQKRNKTLAWMMEQTSHNHTEVQAGNEEG